MPPIVWVCLHSNFSARVRISRSRSSKVTNFGTNRKRVCDFLLVRHSNLILSYTVSEILQVFCRLHPFLFHPNFGGVPVSREIIFEVFQFPTYMWSRYLNVTDGRTDGRTDRRYKLRFADLFCKKSTGTATQTTRPLLTLIDLKACVRRRPTSIPSKVTSAKTRPIQALRPNLKTHLFSAESTCVRFITNWACSICYKSDYCKTTEVLSFAHLKL